MNNDFMLGGGIPNIGGPKIDPRDYPSVKCDKCGSILFRNVVVLKEIPGTLVGQGTEPITIPLQVLVCDKCGEILKSDIKDYKLEKDLGITIENKTNVHIENNSGNLIIT